MSAAAADRGPVRCPHQQRRGSSPCSPEPVWEGPPSSNRPRQRRRGASRGPAAPVGVVRADAVRFGETAYHHASLHAAGRKKRLQQGLTTCGCVLLGWHRTTSPRSLAPGGQADGHQRHQSRAEGHQRFPCHAEEHHRRLESKEHFLAST